MEAAHLRETIAAMRLQHEREVCRSPDRPDPRQRWRPAHAGFRLSWLRCCTHPAAPRLPLGRETDIGALGSRAARALTHTHARSLAGGAAALCERGPDARARGCATRAPRVGAILAECAQRPCPCRQRAQGAPARARQARGLGGGVDVAWTVVARVPVEHGDSAPRGHRNAHGRAGPRGRHQQLVWRPHSVDMNRLTSGVAPRPAVDLTHYASVGPYWQVVAVTTFIASEVLKTGRATMKSGTTVPRNFVPHGAVQITNQRPSPRDGGRCPARTHHRTALRTAELDRSSG